MTVNMTNDLNFTEHEIERKTENKQIQDPQYVCDICGKMYKSKSNLETHIRIHDGTSLFNCEFCGKLFTQKISLKRHLPIHTQIPQHTVSTLLM